ncbi:hypothetical protein K458DRAFT_30503 [Lentithecium fluviatile CBS 122367]|uniref:Uncharacterized protein n=1 Tax=Lentithecium fluviatile CBS 122367 TaxID=1168545 RepID=A0A6G1J1F7_9PLEO|nr:hypothetical protein K458DRAFT_30503 [Lentithecium fluviatile CBS 122367]
MSAACSEPASIGGTHALVVVACSCISPFCCVTRKAGQWVLRLAVRAVCLIGSKRFVIGRLDVTPPVAVDWLAVDIAVDAGKNDRLSDESNVSAK